MRIQSTPRSSFILSSGFLSRIQARTLFGMASSMPEIPLDHEFPSVPKAQKHGLKQAQTHVSTASTGLRIASYNNGNPMMKTLGIEIQAGSRFEKDDETLGLGHLFSRLVFTSTKNRSDLRLWRDIEAIGAQVSRVATKDAIRYAITCLPEYLEQASEILAETTLAPRFAIWDLVQQRQKVLSDVEQFQQNPNNLLMDAIHAAAFYDDKTLGQSIFASGSASNVEQFTSEHLWEFYDQFINQKKIVLTGNGVQHDELNAIANTVLADLPASGVASTARPFTNEKAVYIGGEIREKKQLEGTNTTYVAMGFKSTARNSPESSAVRVLKALLSSRIEKQHEKKCGCSSFYAAYEDVGLFGLSGSAASAKETAALVDTFVKEIKSVASSAVSAQELANAKVVASCEAVDQVVSREGRLNYLASLAFAQKNAACVVAPIEAVNAKAVQEIAQQTLASRPSIASVGKVSAVPRLDTIINKLK